MMNAPCARLMMFMMPHTSENPSATTARIPPARIPLTRSWAMRCTLRLSLSPGQRWVFGLPIRGELRPHRREASVLDLVDDHRLVHVEAAGVEFENAVDRRDVELRQRVAHLGRVERAGPFDRVLERQARRRRFRIVIVGALMVRRVDLLRV